MSKHKTPVKSIYVDADALFDTRATVLYSISPKLFDTAFRTNRYHARHKDVFENIDAETFASLYRTRNKLALAEAMPTYMLYFIRRRYVELLTDFINIEIRDRICIYVNIYPYNLTITEHDAIISIVKSALGSDVRVLIVRMSNVELTPAWILDRVDTLYKYDYVDWLDTQLSSQALVRKPLLETLFIAPALFPDSTPTKDINKEFIEKMMVNYRTLTQVMLIDPYYFSFVHPNNPYDPLNINIDKEKK